MARVAFLTLAAVLGATGFATTYSLATRDNSRADRRPHGPPDRSRPAAAPSPRDPGRPAPTFSQPSDASEDTGVALWRDVKAEYPEESERTWAAIDRAVSSAMTQLVSAHGTPAALCGQDRRLDDAILMVQWNVSTRTGRVSVAGGRAVDADLDSQTRECLDRYLMLANVQFPGSEDIVELDILYEVPFPASPD